MEKRISSPRRLSGSITVPPDKSISHRAAILNAVAAGPALVQNFLAADDCLATLSCLRSLGVDWSLEATDGGSDLSITGRPFLSILTGDESLRSRPMARIVEPLREMGAQVWGRNGGTLAPLAVAGGPLRGIRHRSPVSSAQVKSAVLLAGLQAEGDTLFEEPARSRDHTERMLRDMGAQLSEADSSLRLSPLQRDLTPMNLRIPGDFSAAAFWLVAASLHRNAEVTLQGVGANPTRTGLLDALAAMGADIEAGETRISGGEPAADLIVRTTKLRATDIEGALVVRLIDEVPALAVAAALAEGRTVIRDLAELRVKESDRVTLIMQELRRMGAHIDAEGNALIIEGAGRLRGAVCDSHGDHRLAMALAVAGLVAEGETIIRGAECTDISYPGFWQTLEEMGK
jgi:3-phosphoshikimate 1-carboxyvinyltransferase